MDTPPIAQVCARTTNLDALKEIFGPAPADEDDTDDYLQMLRPDLDLRAVQTRLDARRTAMKSARDLSKDQPDETQNS